jgi:hypothetical protein
VIAIGFLFVRMLCDRFKSRWRLEAEILVLRHQLNVLQPARAASSAFALGRSCPRPRIRATVTAPQSPGILDREIREHLTGIFSLSASTAAGSSQKVVLRFPVGQP